MTRNIAAFAMAMALSSVAGAGPAPDPAATLAMPGVKGRLDHMAVDAAGQRLFVAALGNDTLEVIEVATGARRSLQGFGEPQGVAYVPDTHRLFVANGSANRVDVLDASSLAVLNRVVGLDDADNVRYDQESGSVLVGYGSGALAILDAGTGRSTGRIPLPGHPESFQLERGGPRVFVNIPSARKVVVVDRVKRRTVASWDVPDAGGNFPMALDEAGHRLFVGARSPPVMLVYDIDTGKPVARVPIGGDTDDIYFDAERKRLYVICGEGRIEIVRQDAQDRYVGEGSIVTAPRARTGILAADERKLFVAVPARAADPARILVYPVP